jgi:predicted amidohydrolase YtcJ
VVDTPGPVVVFRAGHVVTDFAAGRGEPADSVAVAAGQVVAVGLLATLRRAFDAAAVVELGGGWIVPGLEDAHCHPTIAADELCHLSLSATDQGDVERVAQAVQSSSRSNGWIKLVGWLAARTEQGPIDLALLDWLAPDEPLVIVHANGHWGYLNTVGLRRAGLLDEHGKVRGAAVPGNGWVETTAAGDPTGRVYEQVLFDVMEPALARDPAAVALATFADRRDALRTIERRYVARGVTAMTEALCSETGWELLESVTRGRAAGPRYSALIPAHDVALAKKLQQRGNERLSVLGLKTFVDGALNGGTCMLSAAPAEVVPQQLRDSEQIAAEQAAAHRLELQLAVHANGDNAVDVLLEAGERSGLGGRIEHGSFIRDDQLPLLRAQGWAVVPFGSYIREHGRRLLELYGAARMESAIRHRSLTEAGVLVAGSSDYPCAGYDPWPAVWSCATRRVADGDAHGEVVGAREALSPAAALALYTRGSARLRRTSAAPGTLAPGEQADFAVLDVDPRSLAGLEQMQTGGVAATVVAGALAYDRSVGVSETGAPA